VVSLVVFRVVVRLMDWYRWGESSGEGAEGSVVDRFVDKPVEEREGEFVYCLVGSLGEAMVVRLLCSRPRAVVAASKRCTNVRHKHTTREQ
jgi:hypothetical protein